METPDPRISVSTISWRTHLIVIRENPLVSKNDILRLLEPTQKSWSLLAQVPGLFYSQTMHGPFTASLTPPAPLFFHLAAEIPGTVLHRCLHPILGDRIACWLGLGR